MSVLKQTAILDKPGSGIGLTPKGWYDGQGANMDLKTQSLCRMGAYCALVAGVCYSLMTVCAFLMPASIASYVANEHYFTDFPRIQPIFIFLKILMFISSAAMIGVVATFFGLHRDKNYGIMVWSSLMAIIGYSFNMLQSVQDMSMIPYLVKQYQHVDVNTQHIIQVLGVTNVAWFILSLGLPGIWFIVVSIKALNNPQIPRLLVLLGLLWGIGNILTVVAHMLVILPLIYLVAAGALIFAPLWSIYEGLFLLKLSRGSRDETTQTSDLSLPESESH